MNVLPSQDLRAKEARIKDGLDRAFIKGGEQGGAKEFAKVLRDCEKPEEALSRMKKNGVEFERASDPAERKRRGGRVFVGWTPAKQD